MKVELLSITPKPEQLIVKAYGICTGKDQIPYCNIQKWIKRGHLSPCEHASASFEITGISRACSHQLVRHRLCSFSQQSQRYVNADNFDFVTPQSIIDSGLEQDYQHFLKCGMWLYRRLRECDVKKEDCRFLLPNATTTKMIVTANMRQWRHVIELRCDKASQWEIRQVCTKILEQLYAVAPNVFQDLKERFVDASKC